MKHGRRAGVALGILAGLAAAAPASAGTNAVTFSTEGEHRFVVPPGTSNLRIVAVGGRGGSAGDGALGGQGGRVQGTLSVGGVGQPASGDTLYAYVGRDGAGGTGSGAAGAGGAPTFLRNAVLGSTCSPTLLTESAVTFAVAGAGGGAAASVGAWASPDGNGGDAAANGANGAAGAGTTAPAGGPGEGGGSNGEASSCTPRGGDGGSGTGAGTGTPRTAIDGFEFGGAGGTGDGGGGGGGGGATGGGGGGASNTGTGGGGAGGASQALGLTAATVTTATTETPSLRVEWDDTTKPTVAFTTPATATTLTSNPTMRIAGTVSTGLGDPTQVTVVSDGPDTDDDGAGGPDTDTDRAVETAAAVNGVWALAERTYASGTWTFTVDAEDQASPPNAADQRTATVTFDAVPPVLTVDEPDADDKVITNRPVVTGTRGTATSPSADGPVTVTYERSGTVVDGAVANGPGAAFSATPVSDLADGTWTVTVRQEDAAGNATQIQRAIDVKASTLTLGQPALRDDDDTPTFSGRGARNAVGGSTSVSARVYPGTTATGPPVRDLTTSADAEGDYSVTLADVDALPSGQYTVQAEQGDQGGNTILSPARTFVIDVDDPALTVSQPVEGAATNDARPTVSGTGGTATGDNATVSVQFSGSPATNVPRDPTTGAFSFTPGTPLAEGPYTVTVRQVDDLGNEAAVTRSIRIDQTAPQPTVTAPSDNTNDATPTISGKAGTGQGDSATVEVAVYNGIATSGTPARSLTATRADDAYSVTVPDGAPLADGQYTAVARQSDDAGNPGASTGRTFRVDTAGPSVTLTTPRARTNNRKPPFSGSAGNATGDSNLVHITVRRSADNSVAQEFDIVRSGTSYSGEPLLDLVDGSYSVTASQTDLAGNTTSSDPPVQLVVDTVGPAVTITAPADDASTRNPRLDIAGRAGSAGDEATLVVVEVRRASDDTLVQTLNASRDGAGDFTVAPPTDLAQEDFVVRATQLDDAGNTGTSAPVRFSVDTTRPVLSLATPADGTAINDATPTFRGVAGTVPRDAARVDVRIYTGTDTTATPLRTLDTLRNAGTGAYEVAPADGEPLPDGTYTAVAEQADAAGNVGSAPNATFIVDTVLPAPALSTIAGGGSDTATNDRTPIAAGTAGLAPGDATDRVTIEIHRGDTPDGSSTLAQSFPLDPDDGTGAFSGESTATELPATPGQVYTALVKQTDHAGNVGPATPSALRFELDTVAPDVELEPLPTGDVTTEPRPRFAGTGERGLGVQLRILKAGSVVATGSDVADATSGAYRLAPTNELPDGTYTAITEQTDRAGNTGTSTSRTFTVDTLAPAVSVTEPAVGAITGDNRPLIRGFAEPRAVVIDLYRGGTATGTPTRTLTTVANAAGEFSAAPPVGLADGEYLVIARQTDAAGNAGASPARSFVVDTGPPDVSMTLDTRDGGTPDTTPALTGTAEAGLVIVTVSSGPAVSADPIRTLRTRAGTDGRWAIDVTPELGDGEYTAEARQTDAAGNTGRSSAETFELDATAPEPVITSPASGAALGEARPAITGRGGRAARDRDVVSVVIEGPATMTFAAARARDGSFRATPPSDLPNGRYRVRAVQEDGLGNTGRSAPADFSIDTVAPNSVLTTGPVPVGAGTRDVRIEFGASEAASYRCEFDGVVLTIPCAPPALLLENLRAGAHRLRITAIDAAGNEDPTPSELKFTVDVAAPNMRLSRRVAANRRGRVLVVLDCPRSQAVGPCAGNLQIRRGRTQLTTKSVQFRIPLGRRATVRTKLNRKAMRLLRRRPKGVPVRVRIIAADGRNNVGRVTIKRKLTRAGVRR